MSACASRGAPILWAITAANHRAIPIDIEPVPDGNIELRPRPDLNAIYAVTWGSSHDRPENVERRRSHSVSCPKAREHRRTR
jgi:hypothetical protein